MHSTLILATPRDEPLLTETVAGLPLAERLRRTARRAGFERLEFLPVAGQGAELEETPPGGERLYALLKPGFLPDSDYLESLLALPPGQFLVGEAALVHRSRNADLFLQRLREGHAPSELFALLRNDIPTQVMDSPGGRLYQLKSREDIPRVEDRLFQSLVKDTEGFMSKHVERRISLAISRRIVGTPITANQMTLLSICVGLAGAALMAMSGPAGPVIGALLFLAHSILDGCDGELARIRFEQSRLGGLLDYWGDNVVHSAVFLAVAVAWSGREPGAMPYTLAGLAIFGGLASAGWIYFKTMRDKSGDGPLYTSVSSEPEKSRATKVADMLSRRDFIYLVVILAFFQKLHWFLAMSAIGAPAFFLTLLWIHFTEKPGAEGAGTN